MNKRKDAWTVVAVETGMLRADIVKGRLESEGIPVTLRYEAVGKIYGLTLDGLGQVEILVPGDYLSKSREILQESFSNEDLPWNEKKDT